GSPRCRSTFPSTTASGSSGPATSPTSWRSTRPVSSPCVECPPGETAQARAVTAKRHPCRAAHDPAVFPPSGCGTWVAPGTVMEERALFHDRRGRATALVISMALVLSAGSVTAARKHAKRCKHLCRTDVAACVSAQCADLRGHPRRRCKRQCRVTLVG